MTEELMDKLLLMIETHPRTALEMAYGEGRIEGIKNRQMAESHDWYCGCGHWNGVNLAVCALCGRTPGYTQTQ